MVFNWNLCCLCQRRKSGPLQMPNDGDYTALADDLDKYRKAGLTPYGTCVSWSRLDEGSGINSTLRVHKAKYHCGCRHRCSKQPQKGALGNFGCQVVVECKTAMSVTGKSDMKSKQCVVCMKREQEGMRSSANRVVLRSLKAWSRAGNFTELQERLEERSATTSGGTICYHLHCYNSLRDSFLSDSGPLSSLQSNELNPIVVSQIVALVENSDSVFKMSALGKLYRSLANEQRPLPLNSSQPNSTRFRTKLLSLMPEWQHLHEGEEIYISSNKETSGALPPSVAQNSFEEDALVLMRAALLLRKICLGNDTITTKSSPHGSTNSVPEMLRSFLNVVLYGDALLPDLSEDDTIFERNSQAVLQIAQQVIRQMHDVECKRENDSLSD